MHVFRRITLCVAVLCGVAGLWACSGTDDRSIQADTRPTLDAPRQVGFVQLSTGESQTRTIEVRNAGDAPLEIDSIELRESGSDDLREFKAGTPGETWFDAKTIEPGDKTGFELAVTYAPLNGEADVGAIVLETNDPQRQVYEIALEPADLEPRLDHDGPLNFRHVPPGTMTYETLTIQNIGRSSLQVSRMSISGSERFVATVPDEGASDDDGGGMMEEDAGGKEGRSARRPGDDIPIAAYLDEPKQIEPNGALEVRVWFEPEDNAPEEATLTIFSNDASARRTSVRLTGNARSACLGLHPKARLDFGTSSIDKVTSKTVSLANCRPIAADDLTVERFEVLDDAGGVFELRPESLPGDLGDGGGLTIGGDSRQTIPVFFTPTEQRVYRGKLKVESNDPSRRDKVIELIGKGGSTTCPEAVAEATVEGSGRKETTLHTLPLETVVLDGSKSTSPGGSVARYEWSLIERPEDSTARLRPHANVEEPRLFLDLAGTYRVELNVFSDQGTASCGERSVVTIEAVPDDGIHVQLVWGTPGDPDETDATGADLDLHYRHPNAEAWNESPYDIYWNNIDADWGRENDPDDDPSLDIDDTNGAGPENVNHHDPTDGKSYAVGVYYYDDHGFGPSYATVRIYTDGVLAQEFENKFMSGTFDFWKVALVEWPTGNIYLRDEKSTGFPSD